MFSTTGRIGKLIAGASTLALASVGLLGVTAANAEDIDASQTGSITVHKYEGDGVGVKGTGQKIDGDVPGAGKALEGVQFTVQEITYKGNSLDLSTSQGWKLAEQVTATAASTNPTLPTDFDKVLVGADITDDLGAVDFEGLGLGLYLVTETASGDNMVTSPAVATWVTVPYPNADKTWNYDVHIYPKNDLGVFTTDKSVDDVAKLVGEKVTWTVTTTIPKLTLKYNSFVMEDELVSELSVFDSAATSQWGAIKVDGTPLVLGTDYKIDVVTGNVVFEESGLAVLDAETADGTANVVVTLETKVNTVTETGIVNNTVKVTANGDTVDDTATTNVGTLTLTKIDSKDSSLLDGAKFEIYNAAPVNNEPVANSFVGEGTTVNGKVSWNLHLGVETDDDSLFWIREVAAPAGYVLPADPWVEKALQVTAGSTNAVTVDVKNHKPTAPNLPMTGAQGTLLFTVAGIGLMVVAGGALMVRRARRNHS